MNPLNYGSLEACRKLYEAGIVVETEVYWYDTYTDWSNAQAFSREWKLVTKKFSETVNPRLIIPAPSMAEVWRELIDSLDYICLDKDGEFTSCGYGAFSEIGRSVNPTDALIELLIWGTEQKKDAPPREEEDRVDEDLDAH